MADHKRISTRARGVFREQSVKPLPGDFVALRYNPDDMTGYIEEVFPRKNVLLRPPVANIDQVMVVLSVKSPDFNDWVADRMLVLAETQMVDIFLVFTKADLALEEGLALKEKYGKVYDTYLIGEDYEDDLSEISDKLKGKITAVMGPSGVGKSTWINALSDHELATGEVSSKTQRGKHTTRHVELYEVFEDSYVFDTPGFSAIKLPKVIEDDRELREYFPEFIKYSEHCKFLGCLHAKEPGCEVKRQVEDGVIDESRHDNYLSFLQELQEYRRY